MKSPGEIVKYNLLLGFFLKHKTMKITKKSQLTSKVNTLDIQITKNDLLRISEGEMIQNVLPHLSLGEREFIKSGITPNEWLKCFGSNNFKN